SEIHALEAVAASGKDKLACISSIAEYLDIRPPSATGVVNKLAQKGYVVKEKGDADGRVVHVRLTRAGQRVNSAHQFFHRNMVRALSKEMTQEEKEIFMRGMETLDTFLDERIQQFSDTPERGG
ncbi:MAG: MarR family winged helix-turn-helix transcriptional regulator, partial [Oscillospiraceae bacterium]